MNLRTIVSAAALLMLPTGLLAKPADDAPVKFSHAEYVQVAAAGENKPGPALNGTLVFDSQTKTVSFVDKTDRSILGIKYSAITSLVYEKTAHPRVAAALLVSPMFLFSPSKKHFLTIHYTGDNDTAKFVIIQLDKKNAMQAVATAEAQTGKQVERARD